MNSRLVLGLLAVGLGTAATHAADFIETARSVYGRTRDSIITVTAVVKMDLRQTGLSSRGSGDGQEIECCATLLDTNGLAVASSMALNPLSGITENLEMAVGEDRMQFKPKIDLTLVKYRLADGTEVPARLVYKDKDLDLAFLVPDLKGDQKPPKFPALEINPGPAAKELDELFIVTRLAKRMSYAPAVLTGRIVGVVTKPRTVYDFSLTGNLSTGVPVFNASGALIGFVAILRGDTTSIGMNLSGLMGEHVIMPASEISSLVEEARKAAKKQDEKSAADKAAAKESGGK